MPLLSKKARGMESDEEKEKTIKQKKLPRPAREFSSSDFVYKKRLEELKKQNKHHSDVDILYALLDTVNGLIPVAEANYHEYPFHTSAAACNHLFSQQREILNDLRSISDFSERGTKITEYVANQYRSVFQAMVSDLLNLEKSMQLTASQKTAISEFKKDQASRFNEAKHAVDTHVLKLLQVK